jgi:hypothetical protein
MVQEHFAQKSQPEEDQEPQRIQGRCGIQRRSNSSRGGSVWGCCCGGDRATIGAEPTDASADVRNRMPVSLRGGGGELGNLKP